MAESDARGTAAPITMLDLDAQRRAIGSLMDERIARVLAHGKYIMGPEVGELEEALAERSGARHVVTCGNGTDALQLPLMAWGIGPGDAVFVPAFTFTATAEIVSLLGATPVFCDVDEGTFNLDPKSLESAIVAVLSDGRLTPRAVIPVDLFGLPADYAALSPVAEQYGLRVVADAAQSFGAGQQASNVGALAEVTATSFFPAKPLGCYGDGGAVFTDDDDLALVLRSLRVHGQGESKYDTVRVGMNSRLDTVQAAILLAKLAVFDDEIDARRAIADRYRQELASTADLALPEHDASSRSAWAQFTVRLQREPTRREAFMQALATRGVPTAVYYPRSLHQQPAYSDASMFGVDCAVSSELAERVVSLPMHPYLAPAQVERVATAVSDVLAAEQAGQISASPA